jgi:hypothetical protein
MKKLTFIPKVHMKLPLTLIAGVILLICAFVYAGNNSGIHRTFQTATTHQPENFTELYFTDYNSLHHTLTAGKSYPVTFTVTNHESKTFTYVYQTVMTANHTKVTSKPVTVTVKDGQSFHGTTHIIARQPNDHVELVVRVLNKNLTIHYKAQS